MNVHPPAWCHWEQEDLLLNLRIQPKASRDAFIAPYGNQYRVQITAPPVDGQANTHLLKFVAKSFGVGRAQVELVGGTKSRNKVIRVRAPRRFPVDGCCG
ncbi:MAG: YggU family protein [Gammaproteobacteria bacterium]|nr:YggU family protein [Gammaproteobacteria bacterium]